MSGAFACRTDGPDVRKTDVLSLYSTWEQTAWNSSQIKYDTCTAFFLRSICNTNLCYHYFRFIIRLRGNKICIAILDSTACIRHVKKKIIWKMTGKNTECSIRLNTAASRRTMSAVLLLLRCRPSHLHKKKKERKKCPCLHVNELTHIKKFLLTYQGVHTHTGQYLEVRSRNNTSSGFWPQQAFPCPLKFKV